MDQLINEFGDVPPARMEDLTHIELLDTRSIASQ
jgi:hypothetical protein